jgi:hypothetical protein
LKNLKHEIVGLDIIDSSYTTHVGSIADRSCVRRCLSGVQAVFQAATLHKPHVATHSRQEGKAEGARPTSAKRENASDFLF